MKCFRTTTKRIIEDIIIIKQQNPKVYFIDFKKIEEIKKEILEDRKRVNKK
jgi:hypothetical protein